MTRQIWAIEPSAYARHPLHGGAREWPESNCYIDLWIGLLHAAGLEPLAMMPFTFGVDLEGDQWTFAKVPVADLGALYGVDVFELNVWRPLVAHVEEQLALGRPSLVEVDSFYLPDTLGTCYHAEHLKTSIAIQALDADRGRLGYFHNAGYSELQGADFVGLFRLDGHLASADYLPPYVEVVKLGMRRPLSGRALVRASLDLLRAHLDRPPGDNPFRRFDVRLRLDLEELAGEPLAQFHRYAFATFRQCGAAFELASAYLCWLEANGEQALDRVAASCNTIAAGAKMLQFKTARLVCGGRPFDPAPILDGMAAAWHETITALTERYGVVACQG